MTTNSKAHGRIMDAIAPYSRNPQDWKYQNPPGDVKLNAADNQCICLKHAKFFYPLQYKDQTYIMVGVSCMKTHFGDAPV